MDQPFATVKLTRELVEAAREEAKLFQRSVSHQIEHWATLGRAFETSGLALDRVREAIAGKLKLEELSDVEQDAFFATLGDTFDTPPADLQAGLRRSPLDNGRPSHGRKSGG